MIKGLRNPEIIAFISNMRASGTSFNEISERLLKEKDIKISVVGLNKAYQKFMKTNLSAVSTDIKVREELRNEILVTTDQLKTANDKLWNLLDDIDNTDNETRTKDVVMIMAEIRKQLEFQGKLLGKITTPDTMIQMNFVDHSIKVVSILKDLEDQGYIKILKRPDIIDI